MKKKIILGSILFSICTLAIAQTALPPAPVSYTHLTLPTIYSV